MSSKTQPTKQGRQKLKFNEFVQIDPKEVLKKGTLAKHVAMDGIATFTRKIQSFEMKPFSGGSKFRNDDTLFARITPCLENGKTGFVSILDSNETASGSTEFIVFRPIENVSDPKFIYYFSISDSFRKIAIKSMSGTSGRQRVQIDSFKNREFLVPEYLEQKQIAEILGAYDDLIEVNQNKIKVLEDMAQAIYKEWFVKPVKAGLPEGWKVKKLDEVADIVFGFNFEADKFNEKGLGNKVVRIRDILSGITKTFSPEQVDEKYRILSKDLLIGMDGIFHMNVWFDDDCYLVQRVARIRSNLPAYFIFESIKFQLSILQRSIVGSTVGHLSNGNVRDFSVNIPSDQEILKPFQNITDEVVNLRKANRKLSEIRDLLIPQLVGGKTKLT